jgi:putative colanic acid biosynthesis UDP-glucose lipid carrier transferase
MGVDFDEPYQILTLLTAVLSYFMFKRFELTQPWRFLRPGSTGNRVLLGWMLVVGILLFAGLATQSSSHFARISLLVWFFATPVAFALVHLLVRYGLVRLFPELSSRRKAVIVFVNESSRQLARRLGESQYFEVVGFFEDRELDRLGGGIEGVPYLGKARSLVQYVRNHDVEVVFVVLPDEGSARTVQLLEELGDTTVSVYYVPDFLMFNLLKTQIGEIEGMPVIEVAETPFYGVDGPLKRVFDVVFSIFALIAISPIMIGIALAVKLTSPGPILFKQKRYGLNGARYWVYKFRSMYVGDDASRQLQQATRGDPRITPVGRFIRRTSLDELPQFFNVIKGEMSVVGPRPHSVAHNELYRKEIKRYMVRHKVKPGVTGWAQVNGLRGDTAQIERMEERIRFDLEYIRNWSPGLDMKIIIKTVTMVFNDDNAY